MADESRREESESSEEKDAGEKERRLTGGTQLSKPQRKL